MRRPIKGVKTLSRGGVAFRLTAYLAVRILGGMTLADGTTIRTYQEHGADLWRRYGRLDKSGRVFVSGEYVGRVNRDAGTMSMKGCRWVCIPSTDPVDLVAHWVSR